MQHIKLTSVGAAALSVQLRRTVEVEHPGASPGGGTEPGTETKVSAQRLVSSAAGTGRFPSVVEQWTHVIVPGRGVAVRKIQSGCERASYLQ